MNKAAQQLGKLGGQATKRTHDPDYYRRLGKLGLKKRWSKKKPLPA